MFAFNNRYSCECLVDIFIGNIHFFARLKPMMMVGVGQIFKNCVKYLMLS